MMALYYQQYFDKLNLTTNIKTLKYLYLKKTGKYLISSQQQQHHIEIAATRHANARQPQGGLANLQDKGVAATTDATSRVPKRASPVY